MSENTRAIIERDLHGTVPAHVTIGDDGTFWRRDADGRPILRLAETIDALRQPHQVP